MVSNRVEIPRGDFTFDNAVNTIIELNDIYNPAYLYIDAGYGEYQIERLRLYGHEHPESGLDKKVRRVQFSQKFDIRDPITKEIDKKDAKNFMVNQTSILLERDQIILSPFDDMVWKQMMDYQVIRISQNGKPQYTSENEHALDAFMLTILGFTLEFPDIVNIIEKTRIAKTVKTVQPQLHKKLSEKVFHQGKDVFASPKKREREPRDNPRWHWNKVPLGYSKSKYSWGRRGTGSSFIKRTMF